MKTDKHAECLEAKFKSNPEQPGPSAKKQRTLDHFQGPDTVAANAHNEICTEWVSMLAAANILLSKTDHPAVREFLLKRVTGGASIPLSKQLQETYLEREVTKRIEEVKDAITGKPVAIMTDEMSDANGRYVLNIFAAPLELKDGKIKSFLLRTHFLEATNHKSVSQAVLKCVNDFDIDYDDVCVINTDNAAYLELAYESAWKTVFPNSVHITCLAHTMNLLGESFKKPFKEVNKFVKNMNAMFWHAGAQKARYLHHLKTHRPEQTPRMPPNPIGTR